MYEILSEMFEISSKMTEKKYNFPCKNQVGSKNRDPKKYNISRKNQARVTKISASRNLYK